MTPFPLRSSTRNALFALAVHAIWMGTPVLAISNFTPFAALVRKNPSPVTSTMIGLHGGATPPPPPVVKSADGPTRKAESRHGSVVPPPPTGGGGLGVGVG